MHYTAKVFNKNGSVMWSDTFYNVERAAEVAGAILRKFNSQLLLQLPGEYYVVIEPDFSKLPN